MTTSIRLHDFPLGIFGAARGEKIIHEAAAFFFADAAHDLDVMIHRRPVANVPGRTDTARSFIVASVDESVNAGIHDGAGTHRTWLYGNIKRRIRQTPIFKTFTRFAKDENFGVRRGVVIPLAAIVVGGDEKSAPRKDGADGNFALGGRFLCFGYRQFHKICVGHNRCFPAFNWRAFSEEGRRRGANFCIRP